MLKETRHALSFIIFYSSVSSVVWHSVNIDLVMCESEEFKMSVLKMGKIAKREHFFKLSMILRTATVKHKERGLKMFFYQCSPILT